MFDSRGLVEQLHGEMQLAADAGRAIAEFRRLGLGDELLDRGDAKLWRDNDDVRRACQHADRRKVAFHLERQVRHQRRIDGEIAGRYQQQGAAVRGGMLDHLNADIAGAPGLVFDDRCAAGTDLIILRQQPAENIDGAARTERHHQGQRPLREGIRHRVGASDPSAKNGRCSHQGERGAASQNSSFTLHVFVPILRRWRRSHKPNRHCRLHAAIRCRAIRSVRARFVPCARPRSA